MVCTQSCPSFEPVFIYYVTVIFQMSVFSDTFVSDLFLFFVSLFRDREKGSERENGFIMSYLLSDVGGRY
jgi:hypothetical protein